MYRPAPSPLGTFETKMDGKRSIPTMLRKNTWNVNSLTNRQNIQTKYHRIMIFVLSPFLLHGLSSRHSLSTTVLLGATVTRAIILWHESWVQLIYNVSRLTWRKWGLASCNPDAMLRDRHIEAPTKCCWIKAKNRKVNIGRGTIAAEVMNDSFRLKTPIMSRWNTIIDAITLMKIKTIIKQSYFEIKYRMSLPISSPPPYKPHTPHPQLYAHIPVNK